MSNADDWTPERIAAVRESVEDAFLDARSLVWRLPADRIDRDRPELASLDEARAEALAYLDHAAGLAGVNRDLLAACEFALDVIGRQSQFYRDDPMLARLVQEIEAALAGPADRDAGEGGET